MALDELTSKGELSERAVEQLALDLGISSEQAIGHLTVAIEGLRASAAKACGMTDPKDQAAYDAWLLANPRRLQQARVAARMIGLNNDLTAIKELVKAWRHGKK